MAVYIYFRLRISAANCYRVWWKYGCFSNRKSLKILSQKNRFGFGHTSKISCVKFLVHCVRIWFAIVFPKDSFNWRPQWTSFDRKVRRRLKHWWSCTETKSWPDAKTFHWTKLIWFFIITVLLYKNGIDHRFRVDIINCEYEFRLSG